MVTVSAPGKIHLMGEHAVVYGKPALLAAINIRLYASVEARKTGVSIQTAETEDYVRHIINVVQQELGIETPPGMKITIASQIPAGYHLGSSAAVAVATAGALLFFLKKIWNPVIINKLAYEAEKKQHGNPSGGDNTAVAFGGFVWFRKELEFLKSMWQLPFKPHADTDHFFLINTGKPRETTGEMVARVAQLAKNQSSKMEKLLQTNERQTKRMAAALRDGNENELLDAMRVGERTLEGMGVVSKKVIPFIRAIEKSGGAAKILGGGGKKDGVGFLLCYHRDVGNSEKIAKPFGYTMKHIRLGEEGVRLESGKMHPTKQTREGHL